MLKSYYNVKSYSEVVSLFESHTFHPQAFLELTRVIKTPEYIAKVPNREIAKITKLYVVSHQFQQTA